MVGVGLKTGNHLPAPPGAGRSGIFFSDPNLSNTGDRRV